MSATPTTPEPEPMRCDGPLGGVIYPQFCEGCRQWKFVFMDYDCSDCWAKKATKHDASAGY